MPITNSNAHYGSVAKLFHWLTALLILTALVLGIVAHKWPYESNDQLALKAVLFSVHKTVGILAFATALFRILWAIAQPRPALLNAEKRVEALAAETAHWLLYGSMLLVPLTGWVHHAATQGFAPILLPIGQDLPFVPKSEAVAAVASGLHFILVIVLGATILAHVGGALKHFVIDKDQTLQRMLPGKAVVSDALPHRRTAQPFVAALVIWAGALGVGGFAGSFGVHHAPGPAPETAQLAEVTSEWQVVDGTLGLQVTQFGAPVQGVFKNWTAQISFDEATAGQRHGEVQVEVAIGSLSLGSVTQQAMGDDFFDVSNFPTARFTADILRNTSQDAQYVAEGTLTLKGFAVPVTLPFAMRIAGDTAEMAGQVSLNRLDFGIGATMEDEKNLGFGVEINVNLTATRVNVNADTPNS
ncbi:cytochrome b/b6 domain-containing protein [Cognatishimia maritima]|uniref:Cytochrome b561 n=1 Tax=Cognatishimia maritima TaxID=870908 RepID=A0A1M5JJQ9_9RHOB|nr:cytochrome b/b6 domain-containing protein [Cognatishimia maritima]SHG40802.1 Cytochrome b561 [Cognatishimia maritima]